MKYACYINQLYFFARRHKIFIGLHYEIFGVDYHLQYEPLDFFVRCNFLQAFVNDIFCLNSKLSFLIFDKYWILAPAYLINSSSYGNIFLLKTYSLQSALNIIQEHTFYLMIRVSRPEYSYKIRFNLLDRLFCNCKINKKGSRGWKFYSKYLRFVHALL